MHVHLIIYKSADMEIIKYNKGPLHYASIHFNNALIDVTWLTYNLIS